MSSRRNKTVESQWDAPPEPLAEPRTFEPPSFQHDSYSPAASGTLNHRRDRIDLASELLRKGYHPVLIFGTRASGKSSLLASLFYYLQSDPQSPAIGVPGEWIVPIETPYGQTVADAATHFLNHVLHDFHNGLAAPQTRDEIPYYIPISLRPNNGQPEFKFAFLESRGEWYHIDRHSKDLFPELREEISDVYSNYNRGISVLLIAPYVMGETYPEGNQIGSLEWAREEMRDSDTALFGALQAYQMARVHRALDKHLFILTKWDAHTRSIIDKEFARPPRGLVSHLISERFPKSWTLFHNMQSGAVQSMQYSSGVMSGAARIDTPKNLKPIMNQFPKMLWGWLYENASQGLPLFVDAKRGDAPVGAGFFSKLKELLRKLLT
jgi:hypothetical protein